MASLEDEREECERDMAYQLPSLYILYQDIVSCSLLYTLISLSPEERDDNEGDNNGDDMGDIKEEINQAE